MKECKICHQIKSLELFYKKRSEKGTYYTDSMCKECNKKGSLERNRKYRKLYPEKFKVYMRKGWLKNHMKYRLAKYGITQERYDELLAKQNNECAICGKSFDKQKITIDHSHKTNKVRGLLCFTCNISLGFLERGDIKQKMEKYLRENSD